MIRACLFVAFVGFPLAAFAQESSCGDGLDNDGDGFIDCFDGDCANTADCDDFYIGKDKLCQTPPSGTLNFGMELAASSDGRTTLSYGRMAVGDLDRDGTPEMVTTHHNDRKVYILNGDDLSIKLEINTTGRPEYFDHAIANIDDDNCAEIFIVEAISNDYYVTSYDCNGNKLWTTEAYDQPFTIGLADFDHDGLVELYYKNEILDAKTGEVLVQGTGDWNTIDSGPVAVDMFPDADCAECAGLELVLGGQIYAVDLTPRSAGGGSVGTAIKEFNDLPGLGATVYFPKYVSFGYVNSMTSIADYNLDGHLDVIMNGATSASATSTTTVFFWDVFNNQYAIYKPQQPNGSSWPHGTGRINVADIDGDGKMNATFVSGRRIFALDENFNELWKTTISEATSGFTSTTVFDFNNDNAVEIVYRDEANLYIIDGTTGQAFTTITCRSRTANDYPIVVDVDGDGATEICVSCASNDNTNINNNANTPFGHIRMYKSSLEPWVSARKVWNQYAYFNVNVNDDLTIPQVQQKHHLVFSENVCGTGENRALNSFLNQSAILDSKGCKTYPSADVAFVANPSLLNVTPPVCPDKDFVVSFSLANIGNLDLNGDFPITFYSGDPRQAGAVKLGTETVTFNNFKIGQQLEVQNMVVTGTGGPFTLFAVLNDNGSTVPTPISLPNTGFSECDFSNNIVSASVNPKTFPLSTSATDHVQCGAGPSSPNGSVTAFKPEGAVEQTVGYTFNWYEGTAAGTPAAADYKGSVWTGLADGTYTVYALHDAFQCGSDTVQVSVGLQSRTISAAVNVDHAYTDCDDPDGQLSVTVSGGGPIGNYTFEWFEGTVFGTSPTLSDNNVLEFARALTYSVLVTEKSSNCETLESGTVPDLTLAPTVTALVVPANCAPANSGQASATVGGVTTGYTFYWYNGSTAKPTADFVGPIYNNVPAGNYTVVAEDNITGCTSDETVVTVGAVTPITVNAGITGHETSCVSPDGAASANVGGITAGFTFTWFAGNGTTQQIGTGAEITGLAAGDYTVEAIHTATGCADTESITILNQVNTPTVTASVTANQTACSPPDGAVSATGTGSPGPYIYYWFNGNIGTPDTTSADFKGATYSGLASGYYTVVAVDANSRCGSARDVVQILDNTINPAIASHTIAQTSCDPATPNGQISADVGGATAGFKFRWFNGADTTTFIAQTPALAGRPAGTYTVKAVSLVTGCFSTKQVTIANNLVTPVVTAVVDQNLTFCNVFNGQVSAHVGGLTAGHDFYWYNGNPATADTTAADYEGIVYGNRPAGLYTVVAVNKATRCASAKRSVNIVDNTIPPAIITSTVNQTSCNTFAPNGQASANVGGLTTGYKFRWFDGADTTSFIAQTPSLTDRAAGTYTVKAINLSTGCFSTKQATIINNFVIPVVTAQVDQNLTFCNVFNGQVSAHVGGVTAGFDFYWYNGNPATADTTAADFEGVVYGSRPAGSYTVVAVNKTTRCVSAKRSVNLVDNTILPVIATSSINQTSCNPLTPNGQASADVGGVTAGYKFRWFIGADTTTFILQSPSLTNRAAGTYNVKAVDVATGCFTTKQVTIINSLLSPGVTAVVDNHLTVCNASNGQVSAHVGGITAGFDFYWYDGNPAATDTTAADFKGSVYPGRSAGAFTVVAVNESTRCASAKQTANVQDNTTPPVVVATSPDDNTACTPANSNGSVSANVGGVTSNHTFHIFSGQNTNPANEVSGSPANFLADLSAGIYTVQAVDNVTGCSGTAEVTVNNNIILPTLNAVSTNVTNCAPSNGSISATVSAGVVSNYTFSWYSGNGVKAITDFPGETTGSLSGLSAGTYTVTAYNDLLGCDVQAPVVVNIVNDPAIAITINDVPGDLIPGAICNDGAGQLGAQASSPGNTNGFVFSWFAGDKNSAMVFESNGTTVTPAHNRVSGISSGRYTVIALDNDSGCQDSLEIDLPYVGEALLVSITTAPQTNCAVPDGSFQAEITPGPIATGLGATQASYRLDVFQNGVLVKSVAGVNPAPTIVTGLAAGKYTVLAVETEVPPLTGCASTPNNITIGDATVPPVLVPSLADNKNCSGATAPGGSITLDVDAGADPNDYTFDWRAGQSLTGAALPAANTPAPENAATDLSGGFYTARVINTATGCQTVETFHINNDPYVISILDADLNITHQTDCSPVNGLAEVLDIQVDGVSAGLAGFTFEWLESDGTTAIPLSGATAITGTPLAFGNYFVRVANNMSGCQSPLKQFKVLDQTAVPLITPALITNNSNCSGAAPNGIITIAVNGGDPLANFTIEWFEGLGTTVALGTNVGAIAGAQGETAEDLPAGTYTVRVTDQTSPADGCSAITSFTIADDLPVIGIDNADIIVTPQTDCSPVNGSAEVIDILVNGVSTGTIAGYTFDWLESDGATVIGSSGNAATIGIALAAGDYYVRATRISSGCVSSITSFTVKDIHADPVISLTAALNNSNCEPSIANGSLTIAINGGEPLVNFAIEWFEGAGTVIPLGTNLGATAGTYQETAEDLPAGTYTVRVTDITSPGNTCGAISTFEITNDLPQIGIDNPDIAIMHQTDCSPVNGSIQVTDVLVNGVPNGSTAGFTFMWLESDRLTVIGGSGNGATIGVALGAGDYYVHATSTVSGCVSPFTSFAVKDLHVDPVITLAVMADNSNCTGSSPNGLLTISVDGGDPLASFAIEWFEGPGTIIPLETNVGTVSGVNGETAQDLPAGTYTVRVTDNTSPGNSCGVTSTFSITDNIPVIGIDYPDMILTHQTDCFPINGSAAVTEITVDGQGTGNVLGYTFEWLMADGVTPIAGASATATAGVALIPGMYFVRATHTLSACSGTATSFTIKDQTVLPGADITIVSPNIACDMNFTGELSVSVTEGPAADYSFDWFRGKNNTSAADFILSGTTLSNLSDGNYTARVTDITSPGAGCITIVSVPVTFVKTHIKGDITSLPQVNCAPDLDGLITVNTVTETVSGNPTTYSMSDPAHLSRFDFQWFDEDLNPLPVTLTPQNGVNGIGAMRAGQYHVAITNPLGCTAELASVNIADQTVVPLITLENFQNPAVCVVPETSGFLQVSADNSLNFSDYTFEWFEGTDDSGTLAEANNPTLGDIRYDASLQYTVRVTNRATGCTNLDTYLFSIDTVRVRVLASAGGRTHCLVEDGSLFATTLTGTANLYKYEWYAGGQVTGVPVFTTREIEGAPIGEYTVIAVDPNHTFCNSEPSTVRVTDERLLPSVVVSQKNPLTYCDPANPNAVAMASVDNKVSGFTFHWFQGIESGTPIYTGSEINGLTATTYVVRATDVLTGCENTASILIENNPVDVPEPNVVVVSHHTNCVDPDGILSASVHGNTADYLLQWYDGKSAGGQAVETGEFYRDLNEGFYTTTATDHASGCVSDPVVTEILPFREDPEFEIVTVPTNCEENIGEAMLVALNDVPIYSIEWDIDGVLAFGTMLSDLPKGGFSVTVTTYHQCAVTKAFTILPEVLVFNGVSRNNDGQNDIFEIACIQDFPLNNVKIFNRAGTLVYEANGYDNQDVFFNGVSNRGINLLGTDLPDGTYFYIINKRDGSEPRTGYLELLR